MSEQEKSKIVYDTCTYQLERLREAPEAKQIEQCKGIFRQSIDYVLSANRDAIRDMIMMLSHEMSIFTHSVNVGLLGTNLARNMYNESDKDLHEIGYAIFLHDIGKTRIDTASSTSPALSPTRSGKS